MRSGRPASAPRSSILETGGCQVAWYNPIRWYTIGRFNNRTHRKSLIIDGRVAFTGGAGIADHWRGNARGPGEWRDTQIRLEGPAVVPLQTGFAHNWQQTTGELLTGEPFYPISTRPAGDLPVQTLLSSPETGGSSVRTMYYLSIVCARDARSSSPTRTSCPIRLPIETLIEAKQRGVDVRIMVSGIRNDNWLARHNSVRLFGRLLEAGIDIQEYNRTMLHQKTMVVDDRVGDHRDDQLRQPLVRAQRGEQRLRVRSQIGRAAAADVHRRPAGVRACTAGCLASEGDVDEGPGTDRRDPAGAGVAIYRAVCMPAPTRTETTRPVGSVIVSDRA